MREGEIIERYVKPLTQGFEGALGLTDDAALLRIPKGMELIITTDMMREGVHFLSEASAENVAWKLMAANLSDIAAMGGQACWYQLALCLTDRQDEQWISAFTGALRQIQARFGIVLTGGDTIRSKVGLTASVTMHGLVPAGKALKRSGAQQEDLIYVTGTLGDAAIGLAIAQGRLTSIPDTIAEAALLRYWRPEPRLQAGQALRGIANAAMDISDGILVDCRKLCEASGVRALLHYASFPLSETGNYVQSHHGQEFLCCISAGDDYELLFTVPEEKQGVLHHALSALDTRFTCIGRITTGQGIVLCDAENMPMNLPVSGYEH